MPTENGKSHIGNFYGFLNRYYNSKPREYSYMSGNWADFQQWKVMSKGKVFELLNYFPGEAPLNAVTVEVMHKDGYTQEEVEFNTAAGIRVRGSLLLPGKGGKHPALVALHDHGGFYYFGREKIIEQENEPEALKEFKEDAYGGRSWASEAAKRGYVVLCIDAFYFGSRKLDISQVADEMLAPYQDGLQRAEKGTDEYIRLYNGICGDFENLLVKHIFIAGTTWPGILFHDDRRCIDYLCTRDEVDKDRIGCCGLSIGGLRSVFLAGLDSRIKCSVAAGWMTTFGSLLFDKLRYHTYMLYVPVLSRFADLPDIACMSAPNAIFIQQCSRDGLFNMEGMENACRKIEDVYRKLGLENRFKSAFYDNKHEFNLNMQEHAFQWLDRWLK